MKKTLKNAKGITLVALVITIIILLILATISIQSLTNTGLFEKAKEAREKTANATENQAKTLNEYEDELNKYVSGTTQTQKLADKVKVGDYVAYIPDTVSNTDTKYTTLISNLATYSGTTANTASTLTQEKDLKWRVLDVQNGQVRLISETPTTSTITLSGAKGYNNAVYLLDNTCKTLYSKNGYSENVQNLKIEDIQKYLTYDYTQYENASAGIEKYGTTKTYLNENWRYYPTIFAKEKTGWIDETRGTELDLSEQNELINETSTQAGTSIKVTQTYWYKKMLDSDFVNQIYYKMFINDESNNLIYWISSRCVSTFPINADFFVRAVMDGDVHAGFLCHSNGNENTVDYSFRPVVTLNSNVQIDTSTSGDGSTVEQAYVIK